MAKTRKRYNQEFREGAVELLRNSEKTMAQVARELGVSVASLRAWRSQILGTDGSKSSDQSGKTVNELWDENQRLRKEVSYLKRQREILKKAASILAETPHPGML